jgi:hypothetical protein
MVKHIALCAALFLGLSCCPSRGETSGNIFAEEPYTGTVSAQVLTPDGGGNAKKESGTSHARFVPIGNGRSRFEVQANIRRKNDSGFVIEGGVDTSGWRGRSETLTIAIDRDGRISGGGIENQHRITFGGQANAERMALSVETEKLAKAPGDTLPAGTRIVFAYDLERSAPAAVNTANGASTSASREKKAEKTCKRRVWKMRNVATPGGGMTMTQVPHCLD